jgi:hypothetical protein
MSIAINSTKSVQNSPIQFDSFLTLAQAAQLLPKINNRHLTSATLWRWCRKGINGIILEHQCIGRAIVTNQESLERFFHKLASVEGPLRHRHPKQVKNSN